MFTVPRGGSTGDSIMSRDDIEVTGVHTTVGNAQNNIFAYPIEFMFTRLEFMFTERGVTPSDGIAPMHVTPLTDVHRTVGSTHNVSRQRRFILCQNVEFMFT